MSGINDPNKDQMLAAGEGDNRDIARLQRQLDQTKKLLAAKIKGVKKQIKNSPKTVDEDADDQEGGEGGKGNGSGGKKKGSTSGKSL